jgi:hypothetical protein
MLGDAMSRDHVKRIVPRPEAWRHGPLRKREEPNTKPPNTSNTLER